MRTVPSDYQRERLRLPTPGHLPQTGPVDFVAQYHQPLLGAVLRGRLRWVIRELPATIDRVLEVGYGSGIFQYELAARSRAAYGIDVHAHAAAVQGKLAQDGVVSTLVQGDGASLPFRDATFDCVVIVSALEFIDDPVRCLEEARRVLRPGGRLIGVIPRELRWADACFRALTGKDPEADFQGGRQRVHMALHGVLPRARRVRHPRWVPRFMAPYEVIVAGAADVAPGRVDAGRRGHV